MDYVNKLMALPTSPFDLYNIAGCTCNIYEYSELSKFNNIDELFIKGNSHIQVENNSDLPFNSNCVILLYRSSFDFGHWCMLVKNEYGYNFLDSYGDIIDSELDYTKNVNLELGQDKKYLVNLLINTDDDIFYNNMKLQKMSDNISTCGVYCAIYMKYDFMNVDDFSSFIKKLSKKNNITCDQLVTILSCF